MPIAHTRASAAHVLAVAGLATIASLAAADTFTIVALPDTQNYVNSSANAPLFTQQTQWIVDQVNGGNPANFVFVTHLGDVVSEGDSATQFNRADASLDVLDGGLPDSVVPWSVLPGNHDYASTSNKGTGTDLYVSVCGPARFAGKSWFGGADPSGNNTYQFFEGAGTTYLHIALEWQPTVNVTNGPTREPSPIDWAQSIISANPGVPTIVSTHEAIDDDPPGRSAAGEAMWNQLIRRNDQIIMVLNGHFHSVGGGNDGEYHQVSHNDYGNPVIEVLQDYQDYPNGGDGWLRVIEFDTNANEVRFETYSPVLDQYQTETVMDVGQYASQFTLPLDFVNRFDFADPPAPPVPPAQVYSTISFAQGVDGYAGTLDKEIRSSGGDANNGNDPEMSVDGDDGSPGAQPNHGLIRFEDIFGTNAGQIAPGSEIEEAELQLIVSNPGSGFTVYRMTAPWDESTTWTDLGGDGITPGTETALPAITSVGANNSSENVPSGVLALDVTAAMQAWSDGETNLGLGLVTFPNGSNGIDFGTSESSTPPALVIRSLLPGLAKAGFTQGVDGYTGSQDTQIREADQSTSYASATSFSVDSDDPNGSGNPNHVLIRFDDLFGAGPGQVPTNREIVRAQLAITGFDPGDGGALHRMIADWNDTAMWASSFGGNGVQADGVEAMTSPDASLVGSTGRVTIEVLASLQAWQADPASNHGWVLLPAGNNGWDISSNEANAAERPTLTVFYRQACNNADQAAPFGTLNFADVQAFLGAFGTGDPAADLAAPMGTFNFADVQAFLGAFGMGC